MSSCLSSLLLWGLGHREQGSLDRGRRLPGTGEVPRALGDLPVHQRTRHRPVPSFPHLITEGPVKRSQQGLLHFISPILQTRQSRFLTFQCLGLSSTANSCNVRTGLLFPITHSFIHSVNSQSSSICCVLPGTLPDSGDARGFQLIFLKLISWF